MILSGQRLFNYSDSLIKPWADRTEFKLEDGRTLTYGVGPAGYDIRIAEDLWLKKGDYVLASSVEDFTMPEFLLRKVCDKSSWARRGVTVQNTIIEPGWCGYLTLEIAYHLRADIHIPAGAPIAQVIFETIEGYVIPYSGKYQNQEAGPQDAR